MGRVLSVEIVVLATPADSDEAGHAFQKEAGH
jgi:hypothetical protein